MTSFTNAVPEEFSTFAGFPRCRDLDALDADIAIIGIPYQSLYDVTARMPITGSVAEAPAAIRKHSGRYTPQSYDFDFSGDPLAKGTIKIVDCGDIKLDSKNLEENLKNIESVIRIILDQGTIPITIGGDHGTPIPVLRAYEKHGPICVIHIDAHLDFRDERFGIKDGLSSPMRRASEMSWVESMFQVGLRGVGSARIQEVEDAQEWGSIMIRAGEFHQEGLNKILRKLPKSDKYYITVDADGLDPSIAPGVNYPSPGGLRYYETLNLFRGIGQRGKIVGFDFVEVVPSLDVRNLTCILGARLIMNIINILAHTGQIGS
jgi:agmatinase